MFLDIYKILLGYSKGDSGFLPYKVNQMKVIKSNLSPRNDSAVWQQLNSIYKKGSYSFFSKLFDITILVKIWFQMLLFTSKMGTLEVHFSFTQSVYIQQTFLLLLYVFFWTHSKTQKYQKMMYVPCKISNLN